LAKTKSVKIWKIPNIDRDSLSVIDIHKHENNMWISFFTKLKITVKKHFI